MQVFSRWRRLVPALLLAIPLAGPLPGLAQEPAARIIGLQMPGWIERGGRTMAARPGMTLQSGDGLRTGSGSRALLRLQEGSLVKLGENGSLDLNRLQPAAEKQGVFQAALRVLRGAFRFTTAAVSTGRREVDVTIGTVTAGIRGTDIWGKSTSEKDIVCLIEGDIEVAKADYPPVRMTDPLSFYVAPSEGAPKPVAPVPGELLRTWVPQTELAPGSGVLEEDGGWAVNLASYRVRAQAEASLGLLAQSGYGAHIQELMLQDTRWFRLRTAGFASRQDAAWFAQRISGSHGLGSPWVSPAGS